MSGKSCLPPYLGAHIHIHYFHTEKGWNSMEDISIDPNCQCDMVNTTRDNFADFKYNYAARKWIKMI